MRAAVTLRLQRGLEQPPGHLGTWHTASFLRLRRRAAGKWGVLVSDQMTIIKTSFRAPMMMRVSQLCIISLLGTLFSEHVRCGRRGSCRSDEDDEDSSLLPSLFPTSSHIINQSLTHRLRSLHHISGVFWYLHTRATSNKSVLLLIKTVVKTANHRCPEPEVILIGYLRFYQLWSERCSQVCCLWYKI